jgi:hypothetical protein
MEGRPVQRRFRGRAGTRSAPSPPELSMLGWDRFPKKQDPPPVSRRGALPSPHHPTPHLAATSFDLAFSMDLIAPAGITTPLTTKS